MSGPRVLVVTIVHQPLDARIHARQIRAMRDAGWAVTYAAPWTATGTEPLDRSIGVVDLPRAVGRKRTRAMSAARRAIRRLAPSHDLILLHDPELVLAVTGLRRLPPVVWDVHEDVAASLLDRAWVPRWARKPLGAAVHGLERWAEFRHHVLLAEPSYRTRFRHDPPVVRNLPWVPPTVPEPKAGRAVYLGRVSRSRGLDLLLALADRVASEITVELVGHADDDVRGVVADADEQGRLRWHGFVDNAHALEVLREATVGISPLSDQPNYRASLPTKVAEYMALGVPVVTTPLPEAVRLVEEAGAGTVVGFEDTDALCRAVMRYHESAELRRRVGAAGHAYARRCLDWAQESQRFLTALADTVSHPG